MYRSAFALVLAAVAAASPAEAQQVASNRPLPLSRAREMGPGATVLVEGVVSVPPGLFDGGFAIQDQTAGIWVLAPANPVPLRLGQRVLVRGTLDEPNGQLAIHPAAIAPRGDRSVPPPHAVATGELGEAHEGSLVRIRGRVVTSPLDDSPWGWKVMVDDGSGPVLMFVDAETNVNVRGLRVGDAVEVTGFAGQYDDHHEIVPRAQEDVKVNPPDSATGIAARN